MLSLHIQHSQARKEFSTYTTLRDVVVVDMAHLYDYPDHPVRVGVYFTSEEYNTFLEAGFTYLMPWECFHPTQLDLFLFNNFGDVHEILVDFVIHKGGVYCGEFEARLTSTETELLTKLIQSQTPICLHTRKLKWDSVRVNISRIRQKLKSVGSKMKIVCRNGRQKYQLDNSEISV